MHTLHLSQFFLHTSDIKIWRLKGIFILMGYIFAGIHFLTNIKGPSPMPLVQHNSGKGIAIWNMLHIWKYLKRSQSTIFKTVQNVPAGCCRSFIMCIAMCCTSERFMEALWGKAPRSYIGSDDAHNLEKELWKTLGLMCTAHNTCFCWEERLWVFAMTICICRLVWHF